MVGLHNDDQIGTGNKLFGQRCWGFGIRTSRHRLNARVIPEHILGGRASQLVGGANEQNFHEGNHSAWFAVAESPFSMKQTFELKTANQVGEKISPNYLFVS